MIHFPLIVNIRFVNNSTEGGGKHLSSSNHDGFVFKITWDVKLDKALGDQGDWELGDG